MCVHSKSSFFVLRSVNLILDISLSICILFDSPITFFKKLGYYHAFTDLLVKVTIPVYSL